MKKNVLKTNNTQKDLMSLLISKDKERILQISRPGRGYLQMKKLVYF